MHHLTIHLTPAYGALVRTLALAERRGWDLCTIVTTPTGRECVLDLTVRGNRSVHLLMRQLERLYDVNDVALVQTVEEAA